MKPEAFVYPDWLLKETMCQKCGATVKSDRPVDVLLNLIAHWREACPNDASRLTKGNA